MIKMVVFDMAGTTVNEDNIVYKTVYKAINEKGYDFTLDEVLREGAGKEKLQAIKSVLALRNIHDDTLAAEIFENFSAQLDVAYLTHPVTEQPDASLLFRELKNRDIYVVLNTGYSREIAEALINKIGWKEGRDFDLLVTASDVKEGRPAPDMILYAMNKLTVTEASFVIKVGDSIVDIQEGRNAGCRFSIGITTGAQTREQLETAHPDYIIDALMELLPIIKA